MHIFGEDALFLISPFSNVISSYISSVFQHNLPDLVFWRAGCLGRPPAVCSAVRLFLGEPLWAQSLHRLRLGWMLRHKLTERHAIPLHSSVFHIYTNKLYYIKRKKTPPHTNRRQWRAYNEATACRINETLEEPRGGNDTYTETCFATPEDKPWQGHFKLSLRICVSPPLQTHHTSRMTFILNTLQFQNVCVEIKRVTSFLPGVVPVMFAAVWPQECQRVRSFSSAWSGSYKKKKQQKNQNRTENS